MTIIVIDDSYQMYIAVNEDDEDVMRRLKLIMITVEIINE